jgi:hypothetical protein
MRYKAPQHVTGIHTSTGSEYRADKNGIANVPDNAPQADHQQLQSHGWQLVGSEKPASAPRARKSSSKRKAKAPATPAAAPASE